MSYIISSHERCDFLNIQIIGAGTVGFATGDGFERLGHSVVFYDINNSLLAKLESHGYRTVKQVENLIDSARAN